MRKLKKIGCITDHTSKAIEAFDLLNSQYQLINLYETNDELNRTLDVIIVLGGDGFMLHNLHRFMDFAIPIYGMNCGTIGFLMNEFNPNNLIDRLKNAKIANIHPLKMQATTQEGLIYETLAVNEVYLFRQTNQIAKIKVIIDGAVRIEEMMGDGLLVSTSAGSSAYNFSAGGPLIPLGSNILSLTPISLFRPRRWRGALLSHNVKVTFEVISAEKRPVSAVADFKEFRNVTKVDISEERKVKLKLLFDPGHSLEDRITKEQFAY